MLPAVARAQHVSVKCPLDSGKTRGYEISKDKVFVDGTDQTSDGTRGIKIALMTKAKVMLEHLLFGTKILDFTIERYNSEMRFRYYDKGNLVGSKTADCDIHWDD